jgi:hypothetical protein
MMKKMMMMVFCTFSVLTASAQRGDPNNKYLVWTNNVMVNELKSDSTALGEEVEEEDDSTAHGFINKYFRYQSMCDWKPGMRFMVIPDKKDMVVRTFVDVSTGQLVSSMSLRHKIMVYQGHSNDGGLHDHIDFVLEEDSSKAYYYEIPSPSFEDYCFTKFGVPTLAYLGDVDVAIDQLVGKRLLTKYETYYVDVSTTSYGADKIEVPLGTEVTVVAAGVGTRNYPVKLIVEDDNGKEFFQTVAISRTNSGMRDEEFEEDNVRHTFLGSFEMLGDVVATDQQFSKFVGNEVMTLYQTKMKVKGTGEVEIPRLTSFKITSMHAVTGTNKVRVTLTRDGVEYVKNVTFKRENVAGDIAGQREDYYYSLFASSNLGHSKSVREENMADIRKNNVKIGFYESEVRLALGEPDARGSSKQGRYTWVYKSSLSGSKNCTIFFSTKTNKVVAIKK